MPRHTSYNTLLTKSFFLRTVIIFLSVFILLFANTPSSSYAKSPVKLNQQSQSINGAPKTGSSLEIAKSKGYAIDQRYSPAGSIISEFNTGQILWSENRNTKWTPASMSKLMTIALTYDSIKKGKLSLNTVVTVKEKHARVSANSNLSNNDMQLGCSYTVSELIDLIIVPSSAAATYMLMDLIEPDIDKFVIMMNEKAKQLGMVNTKYVNPIGVLNSILGEYAPSGDPYADNYTSAQDYACLCTYLIKNYPDLLNHTRNANLVSKPETIYEESFNGHHYSLAGEKYAFPGADGIKTGSARNGYNYSMTAIQGNTRMIEIVLGVSVWEDKQAEELRHPIGNSVLEDAFAKYEYRKVLPAGSYIIDGKKIQIKSDLYDCVPKNYKPSFVCDFKAKTIKLNISKRKYLPGYSEPSAKIKLLENNVGSLPNNGPISIIKKILIFIAALICLLLINSYIRYRKKLVKRKYRRRR